jgi:hypothetical protein
MARLRKPVPQPQLDRMPEKQRETLLKWLTEDALTYDEARKKLRTEFGVRVSPTTITVFWQRYCVPRLLRRSHEAAMGLAGDIKDLGAHWTDSSRALVRQKFFDVLTAPLPDPVQLRTFATMVATVERGERERERLELQRRRNTSQERLRYRTLALSKWKFEMKAAELAIQYARDIKTISTDRALDAQAKLEAVRQRMFGNAPAASNLATDAPPGGSITA